MYRQVFGYATTVFGFWWLVLGAWGAVRGEIDIEQSLQASIAILMLVIIGAIVGVVGVVGWVILDREARRNSLQSSKVRGLTCSIGEVPLNAKEPARAPQLPSFDDMRDVPADFFPAWIQRYEKSHPAQAALLVAMLKIFELNKSLPATHVVGGHGGRTLLNHSLLVAYQMQQLAGKWTYTGLRDRTGKRVLLKLRDESYEFDPEDPLVLLVGLAHDIGKIEAFIIENGVVIGSQHEHDLTGARMLARMPEMWDIPDADRIALLLSIAHYHHPMELPLSPDRRAIDDRTIAVMELLIKADFVASAIERKGVVPTEADYVQEMDDRQAFDVTDEAIWDAFVAILEEAGRINSTDINYNVGTICQVSPFNSIILVLNEGAIRGALMRRLGIEDATRLGDGRFTITTKLLKVLDDHNVLYREANGVSYPAESALWSVSFYGKKATRGKREAARLTGWPATILLRQSVTPYVAALPTYGWTGQVERGTMGGARAQSPAAAVEPSFPPLDEDLDIETLVAEADRDPMLDINFEEEPEGQEIYAQADAGPIIIAKALPSELPLNVVKKTTARPEQSKRASRATNSLDALTAAKAMMDGRNEAPRPVAGPANSKMPSAFSEGVESEVDGHDINLRKFIVPASTQPNEKPQISPYSLKMAVAKVLTAEALGVTETGTGSKVHVITKLHLHKHVPEFDWSSAAPDIQALCKSSRGKGFKTVESQGELYILADTLMMKEFMERHPVVPSSAIAAGA